MSPLRKFRWFAVAVLVAGVGACGPRVTPTQPEEPPPTAPAEDLKALADGNNAFAFDLCKKLAAEKGNIIVSPYSIRTALTMTYAGARGQTADEMRKVLHFTLPDERLHPAVGATAHQLKGGKDKQYELNVANALWGQKGFAFRPEFLDLTKRNYGAGFREADFRGNPEPARQDINRWVEEQTKDRIKELLKPGKVTTRTRLVLVNALYFKGQWAEPFEERLTKDDKFRVAADRTAPVRMMSQGGEYGYTETDDIQLVSLPYRSEPSMAMVVILPKTVDGLAQLEAKLSGEQLQKWFAAGRNRRGHVFLPRFNLECEYGLRPHLTDLGITTAFDERRANFSALVPEPEQLFISDVIHKAMIEVNEEGTVAAAATAVVMPQPESAPRPTAPFVFRADHPFLYAIVSRPAGTVLFLGRFVSPP